MSFQEVKEYLTQHGVSQLLESLLTGLLYHRPEDPLSFLQSCLIRTRLLGGAPAICWDTFIHLEAQSSEAARAEAAELFTSVVLPVSTSQPPETFQFPPSTPQNSSPATPQAPAGVRHRVPETNVRPPAAALGPPSAAQTAGTKAPSMLESPPVLPMTAQIAPIAPPSRPISFHMSNIAPKVRPSSPLNSPVRSKVQAVVPQVPPALSPLFPVPPPAPHMLTTGGELTPVPPVPPSNTPDQRKVQTCQSGPGAGPRALPLPSGPVGDKDLPSAPPHPIPPPPPPPPLTLHSQLSIDSDSDMTESFGLSQEVSVLCPQRPRPLSIFIIGGPGSGKSSQAAKLEQHFGLRCVSLDGLLRQQLLSRTSPSRRWELISQVMSHGELGPQEDTVCELKRQLIGEPGSRCVVVEGFPPDVHQALSFQEQVGTPDLVILLLCSNDTLRSRLQRRAAQLGLLGDSGRALRTRLETFRREVVSVSRYYRQLHVLAQVNADRHAEAVFADVASVIKEKLCQSITSE